MNKAASLACLLIVLLVAACGSGHSSVKAPSPLPAAKLSIHDLTKRYFAEIQPILVADSHASTMFNRAQSKWKTDDTSTWPAYRKAVEKGMAEITSSEVSLATITPPPNLKSAHLLLSQSERQTYNECMYVSENLRLKLPYNQWWKAWEKLSVAQKTTTHLWAVALRAEARRQAVTIPPKLLSAM
jgi:hypothetical protein